MIYILNVWPKSCPKRLLNSILREYFVETLARKEKNTTQYTNYMNCNIYESPKKGKEGSQNLWSKEEAL